jgi:TRAF3-interacting protein 1
MLNTHMHNTHMHTHIQGEAIQIDPLKVVQGLEPEATNTFLIALARSAKNDGLDGRAAVARALAGEQPGEGPVPMRGGGGAGPSDNAESKSQPPFEENQSKMGNMFEGGGGDGGGGGGDDKGYDSKGVVDAALDSSQMAERGKSRGGTRGGKPTQQSGTGAGLTVVSSRPPFMDGEIERCDGNVELTKELMGTLIQKPKMADKLLGKPPFRFLHDAICELIKVTGFGQGLFSEAEMDSATIDDKEKKMDFLQKIISLVGLHLNTIVEAKPAKIVAGQEPTSTNRFLQLLALCATHMAESSASVRSALEGMGLAPSQAPAPAEQPRAEEKRKAPRPAQEENLSSRAEEQPHQQVHAEEAQQRDRDDAPQDKGVESSAGEGNAEVKRSLRPTTARRRPPKVQDGSKEVENKDKPAAAKAEGILVDGQDDDDDDIVEDVPDHKGYPDEQPGDGADAKESKLVQDILGRQAEQETAAKPEAEDKDGNGTGKSSTGIKLGRLRKTGSDKKSGSSNDKGGAASSGGDIDRLRKAVQVLVQHTGPLGTCMDYVQEDVGLMTAELHRWEEECQKYEVELEQQKQKTEDTLKPFYSELNELEEQVLLLT